MTLTTSVKNKEPADILDAVGAGDRLWAHLKLRNRSGQDRKVLLEFFVNDKPRTKLDLTVRPSWSYRTWGYNTLLPTDKKGKVVVRVTDDTGHLLAERNLPIRGKSVSHAKPKR